MTKSSVVLNIISSAIQDFIASPIQIYNTVLFLIHIYFILGLPIDFHLTLCVQVVFCTNYNLNIGRL
jgi:hypothetical protein